MRKPIRIGTRKSTLALWQAQWVQSLLEAQQQPTILVPIESDGDIHKTQPIYALGIEGVFTKALDAALLENRIDIAVHSLKDVPTRLPEGIALTAVLPRGSAKDVLVFGPNTTKLHKTGTIATGSLRRKAQWLHRYPQTQVENLRGNVQTRLQKVDTSHWQGAVFAQAGLQRIALNNRPHTLLDWMIPAPAQGAVGICSRSANVELYSILKPIQCEKNTHMRGCRAFVFACIGRRVYGSYWSACHSLMGKFLRLQAGVFSPDGKDAVVSERQTSLKKASTFGVEAAEEIFNKGGDAILGKIKNKN